MAKAKKITQSDKRLTLKGLEFETDYQLASVAEELDLLNDIVDILWNQLHNLEQAVYDKKRWWRK